MYGRHTENATSSSEQLLRAGGGGGGCDCGCKGLGGGASGVGVGGVDEITEKSNEEMIRRWRSTAVAMADCLYVV